MSYLKSRDPEYVKVCARFRQRIKRAKDDIQRQALRTEYEEYKTENKVPPVPVIPANPDYNELRAHFKTLNDMYAELKRDHNVLLKENLALRTENQALRSEGDKSWLSKSYVAGKH